MIKQFESLAELKRKIFLWVVPLIIIALILNTILQNMDAANKLNFFVNNTLTVWFIISWVLMFKNRYVRFAEFSNLALVSFYHVSAFYDAVINYLGKIGGSLGDFIVWMPIYIMFIFLTLGIKKGLYFSMSIFAITVVGGVMYMNRLPAESIDSLLQFYFSNLVYIIVLYYAQHMFKAYTKMELFNKHAYFDSLTGIANRHRIDEWLENKLTDSKVMNISFSIIFFDIDHFKKINDFYGHNVGDSVLIELAELIQRNLDIRELFGRWGGEEFIIITDVSAKDATELAEYLRQKVAEHEFQGVGRLTASFGVADSQPEDNIDSLLNRADEGLYRSKNYGKNKVSMC